MPTAFRCERRCTNSTSICSFPFKWMGKTYHDCTSVSGPNTIRPGAAWCATGPDPRTSAHACFSSSECPECCTTIDCIAGTGGTGHSPANRGVPMRIDGEVVCQFGVSTAPSPAPVTMSCPVGWTWYKNWSTTTTTVENKCNGTVPYNGCAARDDQDCGGNSCGGDAPDACRSCQTYKMTYSSSSQCTRCPHKHFVYTCPKGGLRSTSQHAWSSNPAIESTDSFKSCGGAQGTCVVGPGYDGGGRCTGSCSPQTCFPNEPGGKLIFATRIQVENYLQHPCSRFAWNAS